MLHVLKAHAYGNDFILVDEAAVEGLDRPAVARASCDRHTGIGADGLIVFRRTANGAVMRLLNADGSRSEISGNGVRCLAALLALQNLGLRISDCAPRQARGALSQSKGGLVEVASPQDQVQWSGVGAEPPELHIGTEAGEKRLRLLARDGPRFTFVAAMGPPAAIRPLELEAAGERLRVIALSIGNPQCVVLGPLPDSARFQRIGPALSRHPAFPEGTNVEFAQIEAPDRVRILIWERGVGPTDASGTGACAAAVASAVQGNAAREVAVISPGGSQRVEWREDGLYLTGWAEIVLQGSWVARLST